MKTVIMAGGKGTRIQSIVSDIPKPMIKINNIPVLEREIRSLRDQGFNHYYFTFRIYYCGLFWKWLKIWCEDTVL